MNLISIPYKSLKQLEMRATNHPGKESDLSILRKYTDLSVTLFNDFEIQVTHPSKPVLADYFFEIVPRDELPQEIMADSKTGHFIHYIDLFDKKDPGANLHEIMANASQVGYVSSTETFSKTELFIQPRYAFIGGRMALDLYMEPSDETADHFFAFSDAQKMRRAWFAILLFDYVQSKLRKEKHTINRLMPTPEQKKTIENNGVKYESSPIVIRDISVRYIYDPHTARNYTRHIESWGVRGHYRHYKNGKVVYIKPHFKGKGRVKVTEYSFNVKEKKDGK